MRVRDFQLKNPLPFSTNFAKIIVWRHNFLSLIKFSFNYRFSECTKITYVSFGTFSGSVIERKLDQVEKIMFPDNFLQNLLKMTEGFSF